MFPACGELQSFDAHENITELKSQEARSPEGESGNLALSLALIPSILKRKRIQIF